MKRNTCGVLVGLTLTCVAGCSSGSTGPADWSVRSISGSTVNIQVDIGSSSCDSFRKIEVHEKQGSVDIGAIVHHSGADSCTLDLVTMNRSVRLGHPLGTRQLTGCRPQGRTPATTDCRKTHPY